MSEKTTLPATSVPIFARLKLAVLEIPELSFGAKCLHGRLLLFAGKNGFCNPSHETLAKSIGIKSDRQVRRLLAELKTFGLISWTQTKTSCSYTVWDGEELPARTNTSTIPGHMCPVNLDKSVLQKEVLKEVRKDVDYDCPSSTGGSVKPKRKPPSKPKVYPTICGALAQWMKRKGDEPAIVRAAVEIMGEAVGYTEEYVYDILRYLHNERGLRHDTENGPYSLQWFPGVVAEEIEKREKRAESSKPEGHESWQSRNEKRGVA